MKRPEIWLALVVGATAGLLGGFFLGQSLSSSPAPVAKSASTTTASPAKPAVAGPDAPTPAAEASAARDWLARAARLGQDPGGNGPTPGLVDAVAEALHTSSLREARLLLLIEMMRKEDFPVVLDMLRKANLIFDSANAGSNGPQLWIRFWMRFGELDPDAALAAGLQSGDLKYPGREFMEKWLFRGMATADPAHAGELYLSHPDIPNRLNVVAGLFSPWIAKDPAAAVAWAQQNLDPNARNAAYNIAVWGVINPTDISRGSTLLQNVADPKLQEIMTGTLKNYINDRPTVPTSQVLDFVAATRAIGRRDPVYEQKAAARLAATDAIAAANFFVAPLPDGTLNDYAPLRAVMAPWIRRDPKAAESWAKGQANSPGYPIIAEEFAAAAHERNDAAEEARWLKLAGQ